MKRVLFLCTGNYYRSRFAEELFNHHAGKERLNFLASSRALAIELGSNNIGSMSPYTIQALKDRNIVPIGSMRYPQACTVGDFESAGFVVAMKEAEHRSLITSRFPGWQDKVVYWHVHDIDAAQPSHSIEMIDRLVRALITDLVAE